MTSKTTYIADDGSEFSTELACLNYEALCERVSEIMSALQPHPTDEFDVVAWQNGLAYIRHDAKIFESVKKQMDVLFAEKPINTRCVALAAIRIVNSRYHPGVFCEYREWYIAGRRSEIAKPLPNPTLSKP